MTPGFGASFPCRSFPISVELVFDAPPPEPPPPLEMSDSLDPALLRDPRAAPPRAPAVIDPPVDPPSLEAAPMPAIPRPSDVQPQRRTARAEPPPPEPERTALSVPEPRRKPAREEVEPPSQPFTATPAPTIGAPPEPQVEQQAPDTLAPDTLAPDTLAEVGPAQLLANLESLQDEDLQARKNPELWAIIRALRAQVARCWGRGALSPGQMGLTVDIQVAFETGGRLSQALIVEVSRMVHDESYRDFAVTARKMLRRCSPYDLPAESYHLWRSFTMRFVARRP